MSHHQLVDQYGRPLRSVPPRGPQSKYDSAQTTRENAPHWRYADSLSASAANSPDVRFVLRNRSRYECGNNGYAKGLVRARANDTIGVCPRLQLSLPEKATDPDFQTELTIPPDAARTIELLWSDWADAVGLADKLRLMDKGETRDGEVFGVEISNPKLPDEGPQLDLKLFEAEQCSTPDIDVTNPQAIDGIVFDATGNPVEYHFLKRHPGDLNSWLMPGQEYERIPARRVHHLYDPERVGECRGIPATTPALPIYNQLREFNQATLGAAKVAASIAGVIETEMGGHDPATEPPAIESMDEIPFPRQTLLTLPPGASAKAFEGKQPAPGHREFNGENLTEAGRSVDAPRNLSTGSSAEYNFSSGKLDRLGWEQSLRIRRDRFRRVVLNPLFKSWAAEAMLIPGYLPPGLPPVSQWRIKWRWDGFASIDPVKDATAAKIRLESGQTTLERECAERGDDWEEVLEQQAREMRKRKELGLPDPFAKPAAVAAPVADKEETVDAE